MALANYGYLLANECEGRQTLLSSDCVIPLGETARQMCIKSDASLPSCFKIKMCKAFGLT